VNYFLKKKLDGIFFWLQEKKKKKKLKLDYSRIKTTPYASARRGEESSIEGV
jgi:hypothetical protein